MCYVDNCCFFFDLKLGAIIIGFVDLILSLVTGFGNRYGLYFGGSSGGSDSGNVFNLVWLVLFIVHVVACVLLLIGAFMDNSVFIILWLITTLIKIVLIIVGLVLMLIDHMHVEVLIWGIIFILVSIYFWICVYSFYASIGGRTYGD